MTAQIFYQQLFGPAPPDSLSGFISDVLATPRGWALIILGHAIGFVFAAVVLSTTVVAFPLLLDRDVGAYEAIHTSVRAVLANPIPMAAWGLIVAVLLIVGSLPLFAGLAIVLPVLGHATWHLYRKVVEPAPSARNRLRVLRAGWRSAGPARKLQQFAIPRPSMVANDRLVRADLRGGSVLARRGACELRLGSLRYGPAPKNVIRAQSV